MSETWDIGPHAEPAVWDRYLFRDAETGRRIERAVQKLANGGWHYIDIDIESSEVSEWFSIPQADGTFRRVVLVA